ncbi:MAG: hypothetical protein K2X03_16440 [Bryobacteraceae bacterium]|nr:hypothetical protein [Bryobacteraceae bacterium]
MLALLLLLALSPAEARQRPVGTRVTVTGYVTVASGTFRSFLGDNGFVLGDALAGVYVCTGGNEVFPVGTAVEAEGVLADQDGLLVLRATRVSARRGRRFIRPVEIGLKEVGEAHEGQLVRVTGEVARAPVKDLPSGYKLFLRKAGGEVQVFLPSPARPDPEWAVGRRVEVTGWCGQYKETYEVVPRAAADVRTAPRGRIGTGKQ